MVIFFRTNCCATLNGDGSSLTLSTSTTPSLILMDVVIIECSYLISNMLYSIPTNCLLVYYHFSVASACFVFRIDFELNILKFKKGSSSKDRSFAKLFCMYAVENSRVDNFFFFFFFFLVLTHWFFFFRWVFQLISSRKRCCSVTN